MRGKSGYKMDAPQKRKGPESILVTSKAHKYPAPKNINRRPVAPNTVGTTTGMEALLIQPRSCNSARVQDINILRHDRRPYARSVEVHPYPTPRPPHPPPNIPILNKPSKQKSKQHGKTTTINT